MMMNLSRCRFQLAIVIVTLLTCLCCLLLCGTTAVQATTPSGDDDDDIYYIRTLVGNGVDALTVNVPDLEASFTDPRGIVQSKSGDLYFSSSSKNVVLKVEFDTKDGTSNVTIVAGTGSTGKGAENILATESALFGPSFLSLIEDEVTGDVKAIIICDSNNQRIRQLDMETKLIHTIAGNGNGLDGGPAVSAKLTTPRQAYYDKSTGDIFVVEYGGHKVRRVFASNGTITTVVGKCTNKTNKGDGGPAVEACLTNPYDFTMNDAGEWFIADSGNSLIRKVGLDGIISTVAGGGKTLRGDLPPKEVYLNFPIAIAFTPSGELLVADYNNGVVRKMASDGSVIKMIAGGGGTRVDGILATSAFIQPSSVAYTTFGILIGDQSNRRVRQLYSRCFGVRVNETSVCSGHGTCVGPDVCECNDGWMGDDCSVALCFGIVFNETSVCSGHGSCIGLDECQCNDGWLVVDCSIAHCFGVTSNLHLFVLARASASNRTSVCVMMDSKGTSVTSQRGIELYQ